MSLRDDIIALIERSRLPLADEKALQAEMAMLFAGAGLFVDREVRLSPDDIVDFLAFEPMELFYGLAIEVKIKGQRRAIYKQLERYCGHPRVTGIVLATNIVLGLPPRINGKPVTLANLGRGWL